MRILIVGATSGIAKECARIWAKKSPVDLVLVGRNQAALEAMAADLKVRSAGSTAEVFALDLTDATAVAALEPKLVSLGNFDTVLIAQGELTDQTEAQASVAVIDRSITINATSVAMFAELGARLLEKTGRGNLALFGSVAGDRGRRANYSYGAAKSFIASYVQGMRHRFAGTGIKVTVIKPGPTATPMTTALATGGNLAPADVVAAQIVAGIAKGKPVIYAPGLWRIIMLVVRLIPTPIFNKLNF
jgi:decaprenylphospho-beta-D-erythro-pentofuranosid-2-ulose 2-reductase